MSYDLLVFDLDGTLVDSLPDITAALNGALGAEGLPALPSEVVRTLVGDGVHALATRALAVSGATRLDAGAVAREIQAHYAAAPCVASQLYDGVEAVLSRLATGHHALGVLTNKPGPVARALLEALGVARLFETIIGDGDGPPRKPSPDALRIIASWQGVPLSRTVMIGDGLPDLAAAEAAPCAGAAVLWGYTPAATLIAQNPTHALARPEELLDLL